MNEEPSQMTHELTHDRPAWTARFFTRLQRYRNLLFQRWWVLAGCVALALALGAAYVWLSPPRFVSVGQMIVGIKLNIQESSVYTEELGNFLGTQAALMEGTEVLNRARDRVAAQNPNLPAQPVTVDVNVLPKTTIFVLRATGPDPKYTQAFLEACMQEYIDLKKQMVEHTSSTTIAGLTDQMQRLEPAMQAVDDEMAAFLKTNDVALLEQASGINSYLTILYQRLADAQSEYDLLRSMNLDQNLLLEQDGMATAAAAPMANPTAPGGLLVNAGLANQSGLLSPSTIGMQYLTIKQQILLLQAQQKRFSQYLKPAHPEMVALNQEIDQYQQMLSIYRDQSVEQLEARKSALALQITNLENQTMQLGKENIELNRKSEQYQRLKAKSDRIQALYDQLLASMETLDVNKDISPETVVVYQDASTAFPDKNFEKKSLLVAGLLGLVLGLAVLMLLDRVDDRINSFTELQESFDEDVLGQIPREKKEARGGILPFVQPDDHRHPFVESYRNLRSSLLYMAAMGTRPHTLLVTSAVPNDGKSVTAANLAITLAMSGARVLLVDADLRKGTLHSRFGIQADSGLSEALSQNADWRPAVKETSVPNLRLLPRGTTTQRSSELFIGPVTEKFLKESNQEYDYVLIDTAPVMAADDVTSLAPRVDGIVFVIRAESTSARVARAALDMLYQRKARVLGLVFNAVRASSGDYYYYYRYKDYYKP